MKASVLIVEDDTILSKNIRTYLLRHAYEVDAASCGTVALQLIDRIRPDIVLIDLMLPDMSGIELLVRIRQSQPHTIVIMMTGASSVQDAVEAMKAGAYDYLSKPLALHELKLLLDRSFKTLKQVGTLSYYHCREADRSGIEKIVGDSHSIGSIKKTVSQFVNAEQQLSDHEPPSVLITGETGCGKELIARAFHFEGPRRDQAFVELNCSSLPAHLIEAELFGYEKGAFTDAKQRKTGLVDAANGGTLFLDEIAEMDPNLQSKLLTFLESRRIRRIGSVQDHDVNVRIIAATNRDLDSMIQQGDFRSDLYYRLRVIHIHVPPLRERDGDIELLARHFLQLHAERYRKPKLRFASDAMRKITRHYWPGNIRELRNIVEQAVLLCTGDTISTEHILIATQDKTRDPASTPNHSADELNLEVTERRLLKTALNKTDGNITRAAELLGLSRDALRYRLNKYDVGVG